MDPGILALLSPGAFQRAQDCGNGAKEAKVIACWRWKLCWKFKFCFILCWKSVHKGLKEVVSTHALSLGTAKVTTHFTESFFTTFGKLPSSASFFLTYESCRMLHPFYVLFIYQYMYCTADAWTTAYCMHCTMGTYQCHRPRAQTWIPTLTTMSCKRIVPLNDIWASDKKATVSCIGAQLSARAAHLELHSLASADPEQHSVGR